MILGFKEKFENGTSTDFVNKILTGKKIHSLRIGNRWRAGMSIQMGINIRSKNYKQFNLDRSDLQTCISVQDIKMSYSIYKEIVEVKIFLNQKEMPSYFFEVLAINDGLTKQQFCDWFFKQSNMWNGQIIHWTNFKY